MKQNGEKEWKYAGEAINEGFAEKMQVTPSEKNSSPLFHFKTIFFREKN